MMKVSRERVFPLLDKLIPNKLSRITPFLYKSYSDTEEIEDSLVRSPSYRLSPTDPSKERE